MTKDGRKDATDRINARLDAEEVDLLQRARALTGKTTSAIVKEALRLYCAGLPAEPPLEIFRRYHVVGAVTGPTDLSEQYKTLLDFSNKTSGS